MRRGARGASKHQGNHPLFLNPNVAPPYTLETAVLLSLGLSSLQENLNFNCLERNGFPIKYWQYVLQNMKKKGPLSQGHWTELLSLNPLRIVMSPEVSLVGPGARRKAEKKKERKK